LKEADAPERENTAPELGQHTEEVLQAAGYTGEDLARLREKGIIA
jgi:crotonobetainyl-CoA:carnitine CoA-transferase CaiB-like acyl-CoA transferase